MILKGLVIIYYIYIFNNDFKGILDGQPKYEFPLTSYKYIFFFCITCMTTSTGEETLNQSWLACLYLCHFALFKMNSTCFNTIIHNTLACIQYSIIASGLFSDFKIKCFLKQKMKRSYKSWTQSCLLVTLLDCKLMFKYRSDFTLIQE